MEMVRKLPAFAAPLLLLLLLMGVVQNSSPVWPTGAAAASCPTTGQLAGQCSQYVLGSNPPVPPSGSGCCKLLKSSSPSCICKAIPSGAHISSSVISNIRKGCGLSVSCPGIGK